MGSHRAPPFLFAGHSKWLIDGPQDLSKFLAKTKADAARHEHQLFLGKEGDVLIWHADLTHASKMIMGFGLSRRSHVAHYTPSRVDPMHLRYAPQVHFEQDGMQFIAERSAIV